MAVKSGKMNKRVTLQRRSEGRTAVGQPVDTWSALDTVWADIQPVSGTEHLLASGEASDVTHKVRVRARADFRLAPRDRILYGTRTFDIHSVLDEAERGDLWLIMTKEVLQTNA